MTFTEFQATKHEVDADAMEKSGYTIDDARTARGLMYEGGLVIEYTNTSAWAEAPRKEQGEYYLILERSEYISNDLPQLERLLYQWGGSSGAFECSALHVKTTSELLRVLVNTDLQYDDEDDGITRILTDTPDATFESLAEMVEIERV
jgi:hypothetical protein